MKNFTAVMQRMQKGESMSNLISTQEAVAKIVDTAIRKIMSGEQKLTKEYEQTVIEAVNVILNTARCEIVRCKDCKHQVKEWRADKRLKDKGYMVCGCDVVGDACGFWALLGQDDDFCSYAEREE